MNKQKRNFSPQDLIPVPGRDGRMDYYVDVTTEFQQVFGPDIVAKAMMQVAVYRKPGEAVEHVFKKEASTNIGYMFSEYNETGSLLIPYEMDALIKFTNSKFIRWENNRYVAFQPATLPCELF